MTTATCPPIARDAFEALFVEPPEIKVIDGDEYVLWREDWSTFRRRGSADIRVYYCEDRNCIALFDQRDRPVAVEPHIHDCIEQAVWAEQAAEKEAREQRADVAAKLWAENLKWDSDRGK